jgi:hypothetical protein
MTPVNSFSAVSLTLAKNFRLFGYFIVTRIIASVVDTPEQFIAGVVDTSDKYSFANISANLRKNTKRPQWNTWGLVNTDSCKKSEVENLVSDSL